MASDDFGVSCTVECSELKTMVNYGFMDLVAGGCVGVDILAQKMNLRPQKSLRDVYIFKIYELRLQNFSPKIMTDRRLILL